MSNPPARLTGSPATLLGSTNPPARSGFYWEVEETDKLKVMIQKRLSITQIAALLRRSVYAVECKIAVSPDLTALAEYLDLDYLNLPTCPQTIRLTQPKETIMNSPPVKSNHILSLLQDNYSTVGVSFSQASDTVSKLYAYKTRLPLVVGDMCVVEVGTELKVVRVTELHDFPNIDLDSNIEYKWIIQKVEREEYDSQLAKELHFIASLKAIEKEKAKAQAIADFKEFLPKEGTAAQVLDVAIKQLNSN